MPKIVNGVVVPDVGATAPSTSASNGGSGSLGARMGTSLRRGVGCGGRSVPLWVVGGLGIAIAYFLYGPKAAFVCLVGLAGYVACQSSAVSMPESLLTLQ
jgi:hypothetical protein